MSARSPLHESNAKEPRRGFDPISALMALVASVALSYLIWTRFGPAPKPEPPAIGSPMPTLRLIDPITSEPLLLLGLRGKVVWVTFWSASSSSARAELADLDRVWSRLKKRDRFAMAAVAIDHDAAAARAVMAESKASLPVYLAAPETRARFGVDSARLPLHLLIDETGHITSIAQGADPATLQRLGDRASQYLDDLEPLGKTRFARR